MSHREHKKDAPKKLKIGVMTISSTRTLANDKSGEWISNFIKKEGHELVYRQVIDDDAEAISNAVMGVINDKIPDALLLTGGTGISPKDVTIEAVSPLFKKELAAFGPLFTMLSYEEVFSAAMMSRASAGVIEKTLVFCMPGSLNACKLACKSLIFEELGHLVKHVWE